MLQIHHRLIIGLLLLLASPTWAAISIVGSTSTSENNSTSIDCSTPGIQGTGNILYIFWMKDDNSAPSGGPANSGGTWVSLESNVSVTADRASGIYRMIVTSGPSVPITYTLSGDKESWVCIMVAFDGVDETTPEDVTQTYLEEEATTAPTATGLTPANNASGDNIWVYSACDVATTTMAGPAGFTVEETLAGNSIDTWLGSKDNLYKAVEGDADFDLGIVEGDCHSYMLAVRDASPPADPPAGRTRRMF